MDLFDSTLSVSIEEIDFELRGHEPLPWLDYLLNPRRLRGSDFLMRWSQGVWSEDRLTAALNNTGRFFALPYGPSGVAPDDPREFELYFERLEAAGLAGVKRPDLLVFRDQDRGFAEKYVRGLGGVQELPFTTESALTELLDRAVAGVECENSLWVASSMPDFGSSLTPQKRMGGKPGLRRAAVVPTVIVKDEDLEPLRQWQSANGIAIHIWHVFFDLAYGISLDEVHRLITEGLIEGTVQTFQAPSGATTSKTIYKVYYHYAYELGKSEASPKLKAAFIQDRNGHILPYVKFEGGALKLSGTAVKVLDSIAAKKFGSRGNA